MALTEKEVKHVSDLAHLELTEEEVRKFLPQLDSIIEYMQKLNELETTHVEPLAQVTYPAGENPALRSDAPRPTFTQKEALANAPDADGHYFKVPQVIERE